jgi:hypothetical protein
MGNSQRLFWSGKNRSKTCKKPAGNPAGSCSIIPNSFMTPTAYCGITVSTFRFGKVWGNPTKSGR